MRPCVPAGRPSRGLASVAGQLERRSVYDAVYVALAGSFSATVVCLDGPLYRSAHARGRPVQLLGS